MNRVLFKSQTVEWPTPRAVYEALNSEFHFDLDPCPIGGTVDGTSTLFCPWEGRRVFCNPPYGPQIRDFIARGPEADVAVFLIPARTDTRWFHELVLPYAVEVRFVKGRLKFGDATTAAPFPSMIVVFDKNRASALARCDRELAEIDQRADLDTSPAYLSTMGRNDWEHEKRLIRGDQ